MSPISNVERTLTKELKNKLDGFIEENREKEEPPCLSNYQIFGSLSNYDDVLKSDVPIFKEAGSNAGGHYAYFYYKNSENNIYIMEFYMQTYQSSYKITDDNNKFHRWMGVVITESDNDNTITQSPTQLSC